MFYVSRGDVVSVIDKFITSLLANMLDDDKKIFCNFAKKFMV